MRVPTLSREDSLVKETRPTQVFLPGKSPGERSLRTVRGATKQWTVFSTCFFKASQVSRNISMLYQQVNSPIHSQDSTFPHG